MSYVFSDQTLSRLTQRYPVEQVLIRNEFFHEENLDFLRKFFKKAQRLDEILHPIAAMILVESAKEKRWVGINTGWNKTELSYYLKQQKNGELTPIAKVLGSAIKEDYFKLTPYNGEVYCCPTERTIQLTKSIAKIMFS